MPLKTCLKNRQSSKRHKSSVKCKARFVCSSMNAAFRPGLCKLENESAPGEVSFSFAEEFKYLINIYNKNY